MKKLIIIAILAFSLSCEKEEIEPHTTWRCSVYQWESFTVPPGLNQYLHGSWRSEGTHWDWVYKGAYVFYNHPVDTDTTKYICIVNKW